MRVSKSLVLVLGALCRYGVTALACRGRGGESTHGAGYRCLGPRCRRSSHSGGEILSVIFETPLDSSEEGGIAFYGTVQFLSLA